MTGPIVIRGARHWRTGERLDLLCQGGAIVATGTGIDAPGDAHVIDSGGAVVAPGLVDGHVHLREPGQSAKETIATGTRAAAAGGFTSVLCMPNTEPVVDTPAAVEWVLARAREAGHCRVHPIAALTIGQRGEQLTDMIALAGAGAVAFSDDGRPVMSAAVMRRALEYSTHAARPVIGHEEDLALRGDGHMNEGPVATRLGIPGIPAAAESVMVRRDCDLVELAGGHAHFAHLSCAGSLDALRDGKRRGLAVTGETCPHYWSLTDDAVGAGDTNAKMNPPLRSERDRRAVIAGIVDGTIDCFATDHAPHAAGDKDQPFDHAPFGIVGLETALALTFSHLVAPGHIDRVRALELWTDAPRRVFGLPPVELAVGFPADLVLIRPDEEWTVIPERFHSKGRNTPFRGFCLRGAVLATICGGRVTHAHPDLAGHAAGALAGSGR
jgi:dihydroorotase